MEDFLGLLTAMPVPQAAIDDGDDDEDDGQAHGMFFHHDQVVTDQDLTGDRRQFADEAAQYIIAITDAAQRPQGRDQAIRRIRHGPGQGHGLPGTVIVELAQHLALFNDLLGLFAEQGPHEEKADDVYKDRRLCIKGKIGKISVLGDEAFVEMSADSYGLRNVKFTLDKGRVNVLDSLQVGDIKVIEGTVVGYTLFKVSVTDPVLIT